MDNYYNLVTGILNIASKHKQIKDTYYGDIYEFHNTKNRKYCTFVMTDGVNHSFRGDYNLYNFTFFVTDRLLSNNDNLLEVQSNCKTILDQIILKIRQEYGIEVTSFTFYQEEEKFADLCAGCFASVIIEFPQEDVCEDDTVFNN